MDARPGPAGAPVTLPEALRFDHHGLVPVVLQDKDTLEVLILAFMDRQAVERTLESRLVHLWSRTRGESWLKGETSGRLQRVIEVRVNCELSSLLVLVEQALPGACHTGHSSCFYRRLDGTELREVSPPLFDPEHVYSESLTEPLSRLLKAYAWLRDREVIPESSTSRILHGLGFDPFDRLREEWGELLGVLAGTHSHTGFREDVALEAYQVLYWTCLSSLASRTGLRPAEIASSMLEGYNGDIGPSVALARALQASGRASQLRGLWLALGTACRAGELQPAAIVRRDLQELAARPYMVPHFTGHE